MREAIVEAQTGGLPSLSKQWTAAAFSIC